MPTLASFFSGIGGIDLGFQQAGFEVAFQCEIDKFCKSILEKNWGLEVPRYDDIKRVDIADVTVSDVWAGGFPCQDVSLARMGPRAGLKGKKSGLFFEFARLVEQGCPRVLLIENVPGLLSSHGGKDFGIVLRTLADIGYGLGWRVLNSRYFGVAQSRQRVYIVGCYRDREGPAEILFERERSAGNNSTGRSDGAKPLSPFKASVGDPRKGPITPALAYCVYACSSRHTGTDWSRNYASYPNGRVRRLMPIEAERLQGFPEEWTVPEENSVDAEKMDTLRYNAIGNAVTVPVAKWIAGRVARYLARQERSVPQQSHRVALVG
ncbi:MAG TPA: DNA (cytosine-5-)-methyltransferase [Vicinamibacterales bacterium]|nr:DNA (cytosine-5-)-methyltransferase [Vicinamibacterales bacterium]